MNNEAPKKVFIINDVRPNIEEVDVMKITEKVYHLSTDHGIKQVKKHNVFLEYQPAKEALLKILDKQKKLHQSILKDLEDKINYTTETSSFDELLKKEKNGL